MKKVILSSLIILSLFLVSCGSKGGDSAGSGNTSSNAIPKPTMR